jgi:dihydroxy-acid dehydratase
VIKTAAASPTLLTHRGPAVVFEGYDDMLARIDDPELDVAADAVLVLRGCGPRGGDGFPEWGMIPIPRILAAQGVTDMVRISDARMSGTSYGTCVLHVAPDAASGGPLALVRDGDVVALDVPRRRLELLVDPVELAARRAEWRPAPARHHRGWPALFDAHVLQAPDGADFDFLRPSSADELRFDEPIVGRS